MTTLGHIFVQFPIKRQSSGGDEWLDTGNILDIHAMREYSQVSSTRMT